ncbi:GNAT family N-acetyltransferase [Actinoalloteichus hymeniacidonis]|uniref:Sortase-like acyltransferase n=1 Tax=Actinoalloteichus hymeniacidonis TaxID=340345 RepID=A0AAC9HUK5_9PSEU|nr:GNAT family N-acetyltransferase [Actinoalloteichus hymeniacidonis]AOS65411.1 sortase-like acyltransferase [Actinoalloteichus hymeniacidonis]MBB5906503.1 L-amino acid N-acyltransferase YncA [Actinoalloteichus hymeniacidonis]
MTERSAACDPTLRSARPRDWPAIWPIWHRVVAEGRTYTWDPETEESTAVGLWMLPAPARVYVAELDEGAGPVVVGTALLKPVQAGLGDHIANASFMIDPDYAGRGLGRTLGRHVIAEAEAAGYRAMQFNAVVETNSAAVRLWKSLGFEVLTTVPEAFRHPEHGLVGLHVMHRRLAEPS